MTHFLDCGVKLEAVGITEVSRELPGRKGL